MSRIGKLPVPVPGGVTVSMDGRNFSAKGPKGELTKVLPEHVSVKLDESSVLVERVSDERIPRAMHGLARSLVRNVVEGVSQGFSKTLEINGVGYRVQQKKDYLVFNLGYSHPIYYEVPKGLDAKIENPTKLLVAGVDRAVGQAAAEIRSFRPPEPHKAKVSVRRRSHPS